MNRTEQLLAQLGFRFGINGPHAARTMMLEELRTLLSVVPVAAHRAQYRVAVVEENVLNKPTRRARDLTFRHLVALYELDAGSAIFRAMRRLWSINELAQPLIALGVALARDPLLRGTQDLVLSLPIGSAVRREAFEDVLARLNPDRFSPASLKSFAQNVAGTWTAAGLLSGRARKTRSLAVPTPESVAMLLFLGYLQGRTGQRLFSSAWTALLSCGPDELEGLASSASHRGLLVFMNAGGIKELRFPGYLTAEEERVREGIAHVL